MRSCKRGVHVAWCLLKQAKVTVVCGQVTLLVMYTRANVQANVDCSCSRGVCVVIRLRCLCACVTAGLAHRELVLLEIKGVWCTGCSQHLGCVADSRPLAPGLQVDRLAFSVLWEMKPDATVVSVEYCKSSIHSKASMTYAEAQSLLDNPTDTSSIATSIKTLHAIACQLRCVP